MEKLAFNPSIPILSICATLRTPLNIYGNTDGFPVVSN